MSLNKILSNGHNGSKNIVRELSNFEKEIRKNVDAVKKDYSKGLEKNKRVINGIVYEFNHGILEVYSEKPRKDGLVYIFTVFFNNNNDKGDSELLWIYEK